MLSPTLTALIERNLLLCVGPLVAEAAGLAGPRTLALRGADALGGAAHPARDELSALLDAGEVARALERVQTLLTGPGFVRLLRANLEQRDLRLPLAVRAIARLSPQLRYLCTTNLDALLERALEFKWPALDDERPGLKQRPRSIMKLCGTVDRVCSWVVTERRLAARPAELPQVGGMLRAHVLLLVGYRADDELLRRLVLPLRGRRGPAWSSASAGNLALVPADSVSPAARAFFDDHGIELVPIHGDYDLGAAQWIHQLAALFERAARRPLLGEFDEHAAFSSRYGHVDPPYPGLRSYSGSSQFLYCGREKDVERAQEQLRARPESRWLLVHGEDGVGKSSFVVAALLPRILRDAAAAQLQQQAPQQANPPSSAGWQAMLGGSGPRPLYALCAGLCSLHCAKPELRGQDPESLFQQLSASPHALSDLIERCSPGGFALAIDALDVGLEDTDPAELEAFAAALAHALAFTRAPFLLITIHRSDRLGELTRLPQLHERTLGADPPVYYGLGPLGVEQLCQVMLRPAARVNLTVPERLATRIIADFEQLMRGPEPPAPGLALAMFNAALAETFRRSDRYELSITAYEQAGGLEGAIDSAAEAAFKHAITDLPSAPVQALMLALVGVDADGRALRLSLSRAAAIDVMLPALARHPPKHQRLLAKRILDRLTMHEPAGRLLAVSPTQIHLVHDALLSRWTRLRQWRATPRVPYKPPPSYDIPTAPPATASRSLLPRTPLELVRSLGVLALIIAALGLLATRNLAVPPTATEATPPAADGPP